VFNSSASPARMQLTSLACSTRGLVALAVVIDEWSLVGAAAPMQADWIRWSIWCVSAGAAFALSRRELVTSAPLPSRLSMSVMLLVGIWPMLLRAAAMADTVGGDVASWEIAFVRALTGAAIVGAALSSWSRVARLAAAMSAFLVLAAHVYGDVSIPALRVLVAVYAAIGSVWLMNDYGSQSPDVVAVKRSRFSAWRRYSIGAALALSAAVAGHWTFAPPSGQLAAWADSSGGNRRANPTARSGQQDGGGSYRSDQVPESIGFSESRHFLDSPRPSLYDVYNESKGEPIPPVTAGRTKVLQSANQSKTGGSPPVSFEAQRKSFTTTRESPPPNSGFSNREGKALCIVEGQGPMHLRWAVYDRFDGRTWQEAPGTSPRDAVAKSGRDTWMRRNSNYADRGIDVDVKVKVVKLTTNRAPTPADPVEFRCGAIDQPDYFAWLDDGVLSMRYQQFLPPGAQFEFHCRQLDEQDVAAATFESSARVAPARRNSEAFPRVEAEINELVAGWIGSAPRGPRQVDALIAGLRRHASLDPAAVVPPVVTDSTVYFLKLSRSGPDYLFASTAADLLAGLGYRSRLASGFYAGPKAYDTASGQYLLHHDDLHFWAEIQDDDGRWHLVEATPGYELYRPVQPWTVKLRSSAMIALQFAGRYWPLWGGGFLIGVVVLMHRREISDWIATRHWHLTRRGSASCPVCRCLRIVDRRARYARIARARGETSLSFAARLGELCPRSAATELKQIALWAERSRFAESCRPHDPTVDIDRVCREVLADWTLARFRSLSRSEADLHSGTFSR